ncbi:valyl tRNA synthetase modifier [Salmonella phage vB_SnwM_CGG4-1]|uniref:Valyl-tRNA synthetase modifier n=1 Tax=Salmonella phage vB_SnwM_CGG4-1 TaxID=1815631 RepID=A0A1B0VV67_9CAUD|nr:valyl tRNA synthetase modifier [Salmonella phage vB_SnwM_CGG4-1]ANA49460.1 valyl-tRNA synthetase modifier [Salmonella phage vB_SnwM_CGG4-1]
MRKIALVLSLLLTTGANASEGIMEESLKIAKSFCSANVECIDILSLQLDGAYEDGVRASKNKSEWNVLINRKTKQLNNLCDKAPSASMCLDYRNRLLEQYMRGLTD